jgi:SAM-dependent methyltransferase
MSPLCESYLEARQLNQGELFYPLHVYVCDSCYLVQLAEYVSPDEIFTEYAYFSSYAETWLRHAQDYAHKAIQQFELDADTFVVELASNDGYLLQYFVERGIPVLGIEPARNIAMVAIKKGIPTIAKFFGKQTALMLCAEGQQADLLIGNNVLAHVPDLNDFVAGMSILLKPHGVITMEFPHLMRMIEENQFDTIYHEHYSYLSLTTVEKIFAAHSLTVFDVEQLPTHGGSLRIYACNSGDRARSVHQSVAELKSLEAAAGIAQLAHYSTFCEKVIQTKRKLLDFLIAVKNDGKRIAGYGAPGKGNTLLNYCGIRTDFLDYTVDRNPYKQGKFLPGTHIPVFHPDKIRETKPDYVMILPWNFKDEIIEQVKYIRDWGGRFVIPIPEVRICP